MKTPRSLPTTQRTSLVIRWLALGLAALAIAWVSGCKCSKACCAMNSEPPAAVPATTQPAPPAPPIEESLFDGETLTGWKVTPFAGTGEVEVKNGQITMFEGVMTGINYTNPVPNMNYEVKWDACRVSGSDFFCSLTFPVGQTNCSLIVGGWGGGVVGLSSLDGLDASENEYTQFLNFENGRWYQFRLRIIPDRIQVWIDEKKVIDADTKERNISLRPGDIELSVPFGFATWSTSGALKNIVLKKLPGGN